SLAQVPAVVAALDEDVDLLVQVLTDIGSPELAGLLVERHAPDVAKTVGPGFGNGTRELTLLGSHEGIVRGHGVVLAGVLLIDVDAQHLAERLLEVLAVAERIVGGAAVAQRDVEIAVGAEDDGAAVVVPEGTFDAEDLLF